MKQVSKTVFIHLKKTEDLIGSDQTLLFISQS